MTSPTDLSSVRSRAFGFILGCDTIVAPAFPDLKANASQIVFEYNAGSTAITGVLIPTLCLNPPNVPIQNPLIGLLTSHFAMSQIAPFPVLTLVACVNPRLTLRFNVEPPPTGGLPDDFFGYQRYGISQTGITYTDCNSTHTIGSGVAVVKTFVTALERELPGSPTASLATTYPCQRAVGVAGGDNSDAFYKQVECFYEMDASSSGGSTDPLAWHKGGDAAGVTNSIKNTVGALDVGDSSQYLQLLSKNTDIRAFTGGVAVLGTTSVNLSASDPAGVIDIGVNLAASSVHCEGLKVHTQIPVANYNAAMIPQSFATKDYVDTRAPLGQVRSSTTMSYKYVAPTPTPSAGEFSFVTGDFYFHRIDASGRDSSQNFVYLGQQTFAGIPMILVALDVASGEIVFPAGQVVIVVGDVYQLIGNSPTLFVAGTTYTFDHQSIQPSRVVLKDGNPDSVLAIGSRASSGSVRLITDGTDHLAFESNATTITQKVRTVGRNLNITTEASSASATGAVNISSGNAIGGNSGNLVLSTGASSGGSAGDLLVFIGGTPTFVVQSFRVTIATGFVLSAIPVLTALNILYHNPVTGAVTSGPASGLLGNAVVNGGNAATTISMGALNAPYGVWNDLITFNGVGSRVLYKLKHYIANAGAVQQQVWQEIPDDTYQFIYNAGTQTNAANNGCIFSLSAGNITHVSSTGRGGDMNFFGGAWYGGGNAGIADFSKWGNVSIGVGNPGINGRTIKLNPQRGGGVLEIITGTGWTSTPYENICTLPQDIPNNAYITANFAPSSALTGLIRNDYTNPALDFGSSVGSVEIHSNDDGYCALTNLSTLFALSAENSRIELRNLGGQFEINDNPNGSLFVVSSGANQTNINTTTLRIPNIASATTGNILYYGASGTITSGALPASSHAYGFFESNTTSSGGTQNQVNLIQGSIASTLLKDFTLDDTTNTYTYTGAVAGNFEVTYTATATVSSNDRTVQFYCYKNPDALTNPSIGLRIGGSRTTSILRTSINDTDSVSSTFHVGLATNDTLRFYVSNRENADSVTVADLSIAIRTIL